MHALTDGRDTPPQAADGYLRTLIAALPPSVPIATVIGRYYAMDRDKRWDRVAKAYDAIVDAEGQHFADARAAVADAYAHQHFDEFILPSVIGDYQGMRDGDGVLCFNFRADRVREILSAILDPNFSGFARKRIVRVAAALGMTEYSAELDKLMAAIFPSQTFPHILGEVVADADRTQLRMAETEKYPHVTYFLNGGREEPYRGRGPHHGALAEGRDLRPAARNVGARTDGEGGGSDPLRQVRPDRSQLRQSRHGRAYRQPAGRDQGGRDGRYRPRPDRRRDRTMPAARCSSPPTMAIAK